MTITQSELDALAHDGIKVLATGCGTFTYRGPNGHHYARIYVDKDEFAVFLDMGGEQAEICHKEIPAWMTPETLLRNVASAVRDLDQSLEDFYSGLSCFDSP